MARSGVGGQFGIATEETFGTYKAPTRFYPIESESLALDKNIIENEGIRTGRFAQAANLHRATTRTVGGDFSIKLYDQGMGIILNQLHGEVVTPTKIEEKSKLVYKQVHKIGTTDPSAKSLTAQSGRPDTGGTTRPFSYLGCKVTSFGLSVDNGGEAMVSVGIDGQDETTSQSLAEATYDTDALPFTFQQWEPKLAGSEAANFLSISMNIEVPYATDRYNLGNSGTKDLPILNGLISATFDVEAEFASLADHERFTKQTDTKLELIGTGAEIGSEGETFKFKVTAPVTRLLSSAPQLTGPGVLTDSLSFKALDNGTEPLLTIEVLSTDSAL